MNHSMSFRATGRKDIFLSAEITSTVWGITPWSDELLKISGDVGRGRALESDYWQQYLDDFQNYWDVLEVSGITYRNGDWGGGTKDYFRETVESSYGFEEGVDEAPVTRIFDTNTFYRQPTIAGPLGRKYELWHEPYQIWVENVVPAIDHPTVLQPTLLSPYAFSKLANRSDKVSEDTVHRFVDELYSSLLDEISDQRAGHVLFHEPYAPYYQVGPSERAWLRHSIGSLALDHPKLKVGLYFSYGDASEFIADFAKDDRLDALGCDLQKTPIESLPRLPNHRFLAGLVDGANTLLKSDDEIHESLKITANAIRAREVSVTHTVDLEHVPRAYAIEKIKQLGRIGQVKLEEQ